jgi:hypothetical protein
MNNEVIIKGLTQIKEGIDVILSVMGDVEPTLEKKSESKKPEVKTPKKSTEVEKAKSGSSEYTAEELDGMTYNDLKKLAKTLGITAVGNRKEITAKILSGEVEEVVEEAEDVEKKKSSPKRKSDSAKVVKKSEDEEDEIEDDTDEEEVDLVEQQVLDATEDMEDDEIREYLEDVDISSKGKRQSLIAKLVQAVKDGKIDFDDADSDESEDGNTDTEDTEEDTDVEDITETMTKKRKKAYLEFCDETRASVEDGEITREDLIEFLNDFNGTKDKMKKVSTNDLVEQYLMISANLIDDDGNVVEEGAYTINDEPYCCGKPLKYDEDENKFICEVCGEEYEGDDE